MAKRGRDYLLSKKEDLFTAIGDEELLLLLISTMGGIVAIMRFSMRSAISVYDWSRAPKEQQDRWSDLVRDALIKADDSGATRVIADIRFVPPWFKRMLESNGFKQRRELDRWDEMVADLGQPKERR